jgi:dihydroceramidase
MIYAAMQALYCVTAQGKPTTLAFKLGCAFIPLFVTSTYLLFPNPVYHQAAYAAITLSTAWKQYTLGRTLPRQSPLYKDALYILKSGVILEIMAFAFWNLDNLFCEGITAWRAGVPVSRHSAFSPPSLTTKGTTQYWVGVFSQGHAWWHILVALGANRTMTALAGEHELGTLREV